METAVESVSELPSSDNIKLNEVSEKPPPIQEETSRKSNGVAESTNVMPPLAEVDNVELHTEKTETETGFCTTSSEAVSDNAPDVLSSSEGPILSKCNEEVISEEVNAETVCEAGEQEQNDNKIAEGIASIVEETKVGDVNDVHMEEVVVESENIDADSSENVRFETEILVEANDVNEVEIDSKTDDSTNNILSELGQSIELSEVLRSSDVTENVDNNNCAVRQEVFNKEELIDILEGNDVQCATVPYGVEILSSNNSNTLEAQMAMEQLSRLKTNRRGKHSDSMPRKKTVLKSTKSAVKANKRESAVKANKEGSIVTANKDESAVKANKEGSAVKANKEESGVKSNKEESAIKANKEGNAVKSNKEENIVKALVRDWDDEDLPEDDNSKIHELSESNLNDTENVAVKEETTKTNRASIDSATSDGQTPAPNKATDDGQPQRRLGRVIKKKVIFDPDNPDTFTKSKMHKNKETQSDKEAQPSKKIKLEQSGQRAKSKSPISKMQWKKPPPKNSKQIKRLSEVDKLLMDEGAVNMIYQLTPEAPKGKKNMKTKAEFIKKLQSSTPEGKEMKFRERKKESIKEEGEAKKILGGKQRSSLSSSVKSPSACDDFETHSADDSIIYRRHSSSSYSSSCMSPRRLSDVETSVGAGSTSQLSKDQAILGCLDADSVMDVVPQESPISSEMINKDDCLSIKKKLNSKLSLALNKRKRESSKTDKPIKKKLIKTDNMDRKGEDVEVDVFKHLSITFHKGVAEISIRKTGSQYNADIFYELEEALGCVDRRSDISLTLMTSECGTLCSDFDLTPLLDFDIETRVKTAQYIAESVRSVLSAVSRHSKVVCAGVWGACRGVGLALLALSDVALASDAASFALASAAQPAASLTPGIVAVLAAQPLPQALVNDLVIFERQLSATEALQRGLISRVLWPTGVTDQLQTIVTDIANQPVQTLLLKKKLLKLRTSSDNTFLAQLEAERALFVEYWSSEEGLEALVRGNTDPLSNV